MRHYDFRSPTPSHLNTDDDDDDDDQTWITDSKTLSSMARTAYSKSSAKARMASSGTSLLLY